MDYVAFKAGPMSMFLQDAHLGGKQHESAPNLLQSKSYFLELFMKINTEGHRHGETDPSPKHPGVWFKLQLFSRRSLRLKSSKRLGQKARRKLEMVLGGFALVFRFSGFANCLPK